MKKSILKRVIPPVLTLCVILTGSLWTISCKDDYLYDDSEPEWLGASIYDYLKENGNYEYYTRLIEDADYTPILSKTGSKTLFVADDDAFGRFFESNFWGISSYENLSLAQKKIILKFSMIDNAFLIENFANFYNGSLQTGTALRRHTSVSVLDTIPFESGEMLPKGPLWDIYREKGIYLLKDATLWPTVHFLQTPLQEAGISNSDFNLITSVERNDNDVHIFNIKVIEKDITCKNGYIHVLEDVLIPPSNIAQHLRENPNTKIFAELLERFCAPYYNEEQTEDYNKIHPDQPIDTIFEKRFFTELTPRYPDGTLIKSELLLPFDPGMNLYGSFTDMAAILCPTDDAMHNYFESGSGSILKERYGTWENVPDDIAMLLLKRHLRESFLATTPGRFDEMSDSENSPLPVTRSDIKGSYVGLNGVVYYTSTVYPPDDYVSVYGPLLFSERTKVFNWAVRQNDFRLYLNSLLSRYSFFVPTDDFFNNYIDPVAYAKDVKAVLKYWYNTKESTVNATVYQYNAVTGEVGDSVNVITNTVFLKERLLDFLDSHIVIGDVELGSNYYFTKNGNLLKIEGQGNDLKVQGGHDIEKGIKINVVENGVYDQANGKTYFIDKPIQTPLRSVYRILSETPGFSDFYALLNGFTGSSTEIFVKKTNYYGIDFNLKFFNTFNYTVYVPTNQAIQDAITAGLIKDWDMINAITDGTEKEAEIKKLERFLRYHFQDNSVIIGGEPVNALYQTATIKTDEEETQFRTYKDKYYRLKITGDGTNLSLSTEDYGSANVIKDNGLYNIMARDYIFNNNPQAFMEIDGTGIGADFSSSSITTSSTAVIHQIDNVLRFE
ncbi:MAG: fasciclin domain-containing protein [Bacteroidales bacterium]|nr:fasciclin domain-containing protein [Bacteroidales bacterium]